MPHTKEKLDALISAIDVRVRQHGCDRTTRFARAWLVVENEPVQAALEALGAEGGWCDCEIILNAAPEEIFSPSILWEQKR